MSEAIKRAMHMLDCEDYVESLIVNWMEVMEVSRLTAARQVLTDAEAIKGADPDVITAARKAYEKAKRS